MSDTEHGVNEALRLLAGASAEQAAPNRIEIKVLEEFRRYHRVRRVRRAVLTALAIGAAAACTIAYVAIPRAAEPPPLTASAPAPPAFAWVKPNVAESRRVDVPVARVRRGKVQERSAPTVAVTDFVPLPYGDDSLVEESAIIVRVDLPRSALRLAGFKVPQDRADERVQADVVLGADGLAHAVRLVKYFE